MPLHYLRLLDDRSVSDAMRDRMIASLDGARVWDLDSGHLPMLSRPGALAGVLDEIAATPTR